MKREEWGKILIIWKFWSSDEQDTLSCYYYYYGDSTGWALLKHGRKRVWDIRLWFDIEIIWTFVDNFAPAGKWTYSKNDSVTNSFNGLAWGARNSNYSYCKESY